MKAATSSGRLPALEWAAAFRPLSGESVSGDHHLVAPYEGGALVAVVDALGHGEEAELTARMAVKALDRRCNAPLLDLIKECHQSLSKTRGVAAAVASIHFRDSMMTWLAIGNVDAVLVRSASGARRESVIQLGGIIGYKLPRIPPVHGVRLEAGDRVLFATDGIKSGFAESLRAGDPLPVQAAAVLEKFEDVRDDALVLIMEYSGAVKK